MNVVSFCRIGSTICRRYLSARTTNAAIKKEVTPTTDTSKKFTNRKKLSSEKGSESISMDKLASLALEETANILSDESNLEVKPTLSKKKRAAPVKKEPKENVIKRPGKISNAVEPTSLDESQKTVAPRPEQLLNFPLIVDYNEEKLGNVLGYDRVTDFGLKRFPSVGVIMRDSQTPQQIFLLKRWREKKIAELGSESDFNFYVQRIKSEGERLHNCLRLFLSADMPEKDLPLTESLNNQWSSIRPVLDKINRIWAVETAIHHKPLGYTGIADCVAEVDGKLVVIDWKVSERQRVNLAQTYDTPVQIIAYIGALNSQYALREAKKSGISLIKTDPGAKQPPQLFAPPAPIRYGIAVIGYRDGSPAHVHVIDEPTCQFYWERWLEKVHQFWLKKSSPSTAPAA